MACPWGHFPQTAWLHAVLTGIAAEAVSTFRHVFIWHTACIDPCSLVLLICSTALGVPPACKGSKTLPAASPL